MSPVPIGNGPTGNGGQTLWRRIAGTLEREIDAGNFSPGDRLPPEPVLVARFGVSRATVRQALASLARRGLVRTEQGRGSFVSPRRLVYAISERTRFSRNLIEQGFEPTGERLLEEVIPAGETVAAQLGISPWQSVAHRRWLGKADGMPIELGEQFVPLNRFPDWLTVSARFPTQTGAFAQYGVRDYRRTRTGIAARHPEEDEARLLDQSEEAPVFVTTCVDSDLENRPILFGQAVWAAERVSFEVIGTGLWSPP